MSDTAVVSGLGAGGADVTFSLGLDWIIRTLPAAFLPLSVSPFSVVTDSFSAFTSLSTDAGASGSSRFTGCGRVGSGVSVCNGEFDVLFSTVGNNFGSATLFPTIHLNNGDHLSIYMETRASAFMYLPGSADNGFAAGRASLRWGGVQFDPAIAGLTLIGSNGYDYAQLPATAGVPEPATWAVMILGFGAAGTVLRRRRAALG